MLPRIIFGLVLAVGNTLSTLSAAQTLEGVQIPEAYPSQVAKKPLVLNGVALRTATFLGIRVYAGSLYLTKKNSDASAILASEDPKALDLVFLRDVDGKDIAKAWDESFPKNCKSNCEAHKPLVDKLKSSIPSVKTGDKMSYQFSGDQVELLLNGKSIVVVKGKGFPNTLLSTWIGDHPPSEELRDGFLGKKSS